MPGTELSGKYLRIKRGQKLLMLGKKLFYWKVKLIIIVVSIRAVL